jgi:protein-glutamine gamma-glutamyltransferase
MKFITLYRLSFYLMLFFATLTLSVDATDCPIAMLYPVAVAVAGVVALLTVDRNPRLGLSRQTANQLALASVGLVALEYLIDPVLMLLALGHWLVYLQLLKTFLPKTVEDDWFLFLLGLVQVLVGAVISQSDHVGMTLFIWALLALWVLALFSLHRDSLRFRTRLGPESEPAATERIADDPYPGLLNVPFAVSALRVTMTTLALGGVIFLAMPRRASMARMQPGDTMARHLTGFDEEVELGQMGEILENDSVVMSIELYDQEDRLVRPPLEPLWRGVTMATYENGRWRRQQSRRKSMTFPVPQKVSRRTIRQQIKLEASDSPVLFGLRPMISAEGSIRNPTEINPIDGTILRADARATSYYDYRVVSDLDTSAPQLGELRPSGRRLALLLEIPESIRPRLERIARPIVETIPPEEIVERAHALEGYLRDSGQFTYTLRINPVDPKLDPVEDFLVNRKEGYCKFYASALTLLLRSVGIPARLVNGFKGGDWNEIAQVLNVRQKHAHSWVEAYLGADPEGEPIWFTLDPTPRIERDRLVASVGGFASNFRQLTDLIRYTWVFFIVGYNADRQRRILYDPIMKLAQEARRGFRIMGQALRDAAADLFIFQDVDQFFSIRGLVVSFTVMLLLVLLFLAIQWTWRRCVRWYRGPEGDSAALTPGVLFYRRLVQLLGEFGLERPPAETQQEFARRARAFLAGHGSTTEAVADVPRQVVEAFYRVRFGQRDLAPGSLRDLEGRLDALEASLHGTRE